MTRWKITMEYDGTHFCGWQKQASATAVQQVLEEAVERFSGERVQIHAAGRTDAGVHALGQVAHFDLEKPTTPFEIIGAINFHVRPHAIIVTDVCAVASDFHARFSALSRSYRYHILNRRAPSVFMASTSWHIHKNLEVEPMQMAADALIGKHDFSTFRAQHCQATSPIRTLDAIAIRRDGDLVILTCLARSFLYHQVRNMVGTLSLVGGGVWSVEDFKNAFAAHDRTRGGPTAPPQGLFFDRVSYPQT